jgi:hypothetical protein
MLGAITAVWLMPFLALTLALAWPVAIAPFAPVIATACRRTAWTLPIPAIPVTTRPTVA